MVVAHKGTGNNGLSRTRNAIGLTFGGADLASSKAGERQARVARGRSTRWNGGDVEECLERRCHDVYFQEIRSPLSTVRRSGECPTARLQEA